MLLHGYRELRTGDGATEPRRKGKTLFLIPGDVAMYTVLFNPEGTVKTLFLIPGDGCITITLRD